MVANDLPQAERVRAASPRAMVTSVTMGYGHLRAAYPLAECFDSPVWCVDEPPLAEPGEAALWSWVRRMHEVLSKPLPGMGGLEAPMRGLMNLATMIPSLHEPRDHWRPTWAVRLLDQLIAKGLGRGMLDRLRSAQVPLVTTFYAPAIIADRAGFGPIFCVVTDADCNRVWAPVDASRTRIHYCAPSPRVVRRLRSFGVPASNITLTGFPLPAALTDAADPHQTRLASRLARLDPCHVFRAVHAEELERLPPASTPSSPLTVLFAVGGAGAQAELVRQFLPSLRPAISSGKMRLSLVAGMRREVVLSFLESLKAADLLHTLGAQVEIVSGKSFEAYYTAMNAALRRADVLWTKPSEMAFYAATGLACVLAPPVGAHERYNRRFLRELGAGVKQRRPEHALGWLEEWLEDGTLAGCAWAGYRRMPRGGVQAIDALVEQGR